MLVRHTACTGGSSDIAAVIDGYRSDCSKLVVFGKRNCPGCPLLIQLLPPSWRDEVGLGLLGQLILSHVLVGSSPG
jgi:hypothetical protein